MKKTTFITIIIIVSVLLYAGYITYKITNVDGDDAQSAAAQTFGEDSGAVYTDLEGNVVSLDDYSGKVRVVNTWASWCPFCVQELADFETLAQEYADTDVIVIAINRKESYQKAKNFLEKIGDFNRLVFIMDPDDSFYTAMGGFAMPETIFYDAKGDIVLHKRGFMNLEEMKKHTETAIVSTQ